MAARMADETVLIVEDDPAMLRGLKDNFEFEGYGVVTAADGETGLEAALNSGADLILLGMAQPGEDFLEYYEGLQRLIEGLPTAIFVLASEDLAFEEILLQHEQRAAERV